MTDGLSVHWFLPTGGDSRDVVPHPLYPHRREPDHSYLAQIAMACDRLGFDAMLTPCGTACEDAWISTASLIPLTSRIRFLVAFRPGLLSPTLAAQMASTYQRMSGGRLAVNIVTGAEPEELARFGDWADKATRYERTGEFLSIMRSAWSGYPVDYDGEHYRVAGATTRTQPDPAPPVYFGGASAEAERVAAEHSDVYLTWGETPQMVGERADRVASLAAGYGRGLRFGIRFHAIVRPTSEEAWAEASRLLASMTPEAITAARADFERTASEGQRRMAELSSGGDPADPRSMLIHPAVWSGIGLVRGGAGTALVGSPAEVADTMEQYAAHGFREFILSGYPHLEEAYAVGELLLPELARRGLVAPPAPAAPEGRFSTFR